MRADRFGNPQDDEAAGAVQAGFTSPPGRDRPAPFYQCRDMRTAEDVRP